MVSWVSWKRPPAHIYNISPEVQWQMRARVGACGQLKVAILEGASRIENTTKEWEWLSERVYQANSACATSATKPLPLTVKH